MPDLSLYKVDLDTPQPNGRKGESPRAAFTKYNDLLAHLEAGGGGSFISPTEPTQTFAFMEWIDISSSPAIIKRRNADNSAWITIGSYEKPITDFVDKVAGKGLSTNDYTNEAKGIVDGVGNALNAGKVLSTNDYTNEAKGIVDGVGNALNAGKVLSTNDYTNEAKGIVDGVGNALNAGKVLSTNDYENADKALVSALLSSRLFEKSIGDEPAFMVSGGQLKTACNITVIVDGQLLTFGANETITTPTLISGVDYAIYATDDGLIVSSNFTMPAGYTADNSRRIGGFHYGNNEFKNYSFYDLNFRPKCKDPRGMVVDVSGSRFWNDIYLLNSTPDALGTSAYNAKIADGGSPCKIPVLWGGNGTAQYPNLTQYIAAEVLAAYGKRLPSHDEFEILALGSTPGYTAGADPVTTKFDVNARSNNGSEQVSGHLWQWGKDVWDRGGGSSGYAWYAADTNGEGQVYSAGSQAVGAVLLGAAWGNSGIAGARASVWNGEPWDSNVDVGARGLCDHLLHV